MTIFENIELFVRAEVTDLTASYTSVCTFITCIIQVNVHPLLFSLPTVEYRLVGEVPFRLSCICKTFSYTSKLC